MPTLHNKKIISIDFEQKKIAHFLKRFKIFANLTPLVSRLVQNAND